MTVFHCLTHTSGITDHDEDYKPLFVDKPNSSIRETADFLPQFVETKPNSAPGDSVHENLVEHYKRTEHEDRTVEWRKNICSYPPVGSPNGGVAVTAWDLDR